MFDLRTCDYYDDRSHVTSWRSCGLFSQVKQPLSLVASSFNETEDYYCPLVMVDPHQRGLWDCWCFLSSPEIPSDPPVELQCIQMSRR